MEDQRTLDDLLRDGGNIQVEKPFKPHTFYNSSGDSLEFYASDEPRVAERINSLLTVFVSAVDRNKVIGIVIKNIEKHFGQHTQLNFIAKMGRAKIALLVRGVQFSQAFAFKRIEQNVEMAALLERAIGEIGEMEVDLPRLEHAAS